MDDKKVIQVCKNRGTGISFVSPSAHFHQLIPLLPSSCFSYSNPQISIRFFFLLFVLCIFPPGFVRVSFSFSLSPFHSRSSSPSRFASPFHSDSPDPSYPPPSFLRFFLFISGGFLSLSLSFSLFFIFFFELFIPRWTSATSGQRSKHCTEGRIVPSTRSFPFFSSPNVYRHPFQSSTCQQFIHSQI